MRKGLKLKGAREADWGVGVVGPARAIALRALRQHLRDAQPLPEGSHLDLQTC